MNFFNRILIVGAHYDDAELGCGGTASRFAEMGKKVYKITLTNNRTNDSINNVFVTPDAKFESVEAASLIGYEEIDFDPIECNSLVYSTNSMQKLERIIHQYDIDTVFTHHFYDLNQDHVEASKICLTASRKVKNLIYYKSNMYHNPHFAPNLFIDISKFHSQKAKALRSYSDVHDRGGVLFKTTLEKNIVDGASIGVDAAEIFEVSRIVS